MQLLEYHRAQLADRAGQEAFRTALAETLKGGETVLDLGTGTGVHTLFACQAGAKRVYAVERTEVIEWARLLARENGFSDRITFIHGSAEDLDLPERVDVIVAHTGVPALLSTLPKVRDRWLKEGGRLIPVRMEFTLAPLEAERAHRDLVAFWDGDVGGASLAPLRAIAANAVYACPTHPCESLGPTVTAAAFQLQNVRDPTLSTSVESPIIRRGVLHGISLGFTLFLTSKIAVATGPSSLLPSEVWPSWFLPIDRPIPVEPGEVARMSIRTGAGGWGKVWMWELRLVGKSGVERAHASQSTWVSTPLTPETLRRQDPRHAPTLSPKGLAVRWILDSCDGRESLESLESKVLRLFPGMFADRAEAAAFVAEVISRHAV